MSQYRYTRDLIQTALFQSNEPIDNGSDFYVQAINYLNRAYQALWTGGAELDPNVNEEWMWLLSSTPGTITLLPVVIRTAIVTNGSANLTLNTIPAGSLAGYFVRATNNGDIYRVATHIAGSATATLDSIYTGPDAATESLRLFKVEYDLPTDVLRLISPMRQYREGDGKIDGMALSEMEDKYPPHLFQSGVPKAFAQIGQSKVRFSHAGMENAGEYIRVDFDYLQKPSDEPLIDNSTQEPLVPYVWRHILSDFTTFFLLVDKNDNRADSWGLMAKAGLRAMAKENRARWAKFGREMGRIFPRQDDLPQNNDVLRTESGIIIG